MTMDDEQIIEPVGTPTVDATLQPNSEIETEIPEPLNTPPSPVTITDIPPTTLDPASPPAEPPIVEPVVIPEPPQASNTVPQPSVPPPVPVTTPVATEPDLPRSSSPELTTVDLSPITATFDVAQLSDEQLKAAAALYTKRNQAELSKKGVAKRHETMELNLREIVDFLSLNNGSPLPRIAKHTNITLGTTSKYLRQLNAKGKVRAEGWAKNRRYYLK